MVLHRHRKVAGERNLKGRQQPAQTFRVHIAQGEGGGLRRRGFGESHPPGLHLLQAVAQGESGLGGSRDRQPPGQMAPHRLADGAAAHQPALQKEGPSRIA